MTTLVAATGAGAWLLLIGAAIAGLAFGMIMNSVLTGRRKKK
ncbi:MAG TPA: hypothetical protein VFZ86_09150 [Thermoleophilia bacterium]|nr:hypothetical protein [Thermoleophilia bacterium]